MEQLTALDASFLNLETPTAPMHIAGLCIYDPSTAPDGCSFAQYAKHIESRLPRAKTFRQRLIEVPFNLDYPYWVDDPEFDLEYHLRHIALPAPGDWEQLMRQFGRLMSRPLDRNRPLWEIYYIEGLDAIEWLPKGCFATITKVHHSAIDGVSGVDLAAAIHDLSPAQEVVLPESPRQIEPLPGEWDVLAKAVGPLLRTPLSVAGALGHLVGTTLKAGQRERIEKEAAPTAPFTAPRTRFNDVVTTHRVIDGIVLDLADIKSVKNAVEGGTVNDVVLAVCSGAFRRYLDEKGELPEKSMVALAPISVRPEEGRGQMGNQISAMLVSLATNVDDPIERMRLIHASAAASKEYDKAVKGSVLTDISQSIPSAVANLAVRLYSRMELARRHAPICNGIITNVPGPQFPLYAAGAKLLMQFGSGTLMDGVGFMVAIYSHDGAVTLTITSDRLMMPDVQHFAECLQDAFDELKAAALPAKKKPARAKAKRKAAAAPKTRKKAAAKRKAPAKARTSARSGAKSDAKTGSKAAAKAGGKAKAAKRPAKAKPASKLTSDQVSANANGSGANGSGEGVSGQAPAE